MTIVLKSFSTRLSFYILALTCLIFSCIAVVFYSYSKEREESQAVQYTALIQQNILQKVDFKLKSVEHTLRDEIPTIIRHHDSPDEMMKVVRNIVENDSLIMGGGIAFLPNFYPDKGHWFMEYAYLNEQKQLVDKSLGNEHYDYFKQHWFKEACQHRNGCWIAPYMDKGASKKLMATFTLPLYSDDGKMFAVLTADISIKDLAANVNALRPFDNSYTFLIGKDSHDKDSNRHQQMVISKNIIHNVSYLNDHDLIEISHYVQKSKRGWQRCTINNIDLLACYTPINRIGLSICSVTPYDTIMSELGSATWYFLLILLVGLLLLLFCIRKLINTLSGPMHEMTEAAYEISSGNFEYKLPVIKSKDELRQLHDAFEHMQISLRQHVEQLKIAAHQEERIKSELDIASHIQMDMLSKNFSLLPNNSGFELYATLKSAREVGGDFYDFFTREGKFYFCIGDVSGKGVPASLVMAMTTMLFRVLTKRAESAAHIMRELNSTMSNDNEANMFVTMWIGVVDLSTQVLTYCNAGHNQPLLLQADGTCVDVKAKACLPIGIMKNVEYTDYSLRMENQQTILLYTDGVTEAENTLHEQFGIDRMRNAFIASGHSTAKECIEHIQHDVSTFVGEAEASDDITLLCLQLNNNAHKEANNVQSVVFSNKLDDVAMLQPFVESVGKYLLMAPDLVSKINLAIEEALVNVVNYAYPDGSKGTITLKASWNEPRSYVCFELIDAGKPFNPLTESQPNLSSDIESRQVGGLGIFLMRNMMDEVNYEYAQGQNHLIMKKYL